MSKTLLKALQFSLSTFLLCYLYYKLDVSLPSLTSSLTEYKWFLLAVLFRILCMPLFAAIRWKIFLRYVGVKEGIFSLVQINFMSAFWSLLLPSSSGHDVVRIYLIEKYHPEARAKVGSTVIVERLIGFILLSILGFIGSLSIDDFDRIAYVRFILASLVFVLLSILAASTSARFYKIMIRYSNKIRFARRPIDYVSMVHDSIVQMPLKSILIRALPFMLMFQLSTIVLGYLIFKAFGVHVSFIYHLALLPLIQIITLLPISVSGFGVREGAFVYFYSLLGVSPTISFSVSILYYVIAVGFPAICGYVISLMKHQRAPTPVS